MIGTYLTNLNVLSLVGIVIVMALLATISTEFASNSAIATIFLPIAGQLVSDGQVFGDIFLMTTITGLESGCKPLNADDTDHSFLFICIRTSSGNTGQRTGGQSCELGLQRYGWLFTCEEIQMRTNLFSAHPRHYHQNNMSDRDVDQRVGDWSAHVQPERVPRVGHYCLRRVPD